MVPLVFPFVNPILFLGVLELSKCIARIGCPCQNSCSCNLTGFLAVFTPAKSIVDLN